MLKRFYFLLTSSLCFLSAAGQSNPALKAFGRMLSDSCEGRFYNWYFHDELRDALYGHPGNAVKMEQLLADTSADEKARFYAAEILFEKDTTFLQRIDKAALARLYARFLKADLLYESNLWGIEPYDGDLGYSGEHFVRIGKAADPALKALLDDKRVLNTYEGSKEATVGNGNRYRVKDIAACYLAAIHHLAVHYYQDTAARDAAILLLRQKI